VILLEASFIGLLEEADANSKKGLPARSERVARIGSVAVEDIDGPRNGIVYEWIVMRVPLTKVVVALIGETSNDAGPVETSSPVETLLRIGEIKLRRDCAVCDLGSRVGPGSDVSIGEAR
jgi:hypothetical protein